MYFVRFAFVLSVVLCCSGAYAYTLTFDDIPAGNDLKYYSDQYGATFSYGFAATDHSQSSWGLSHSGTKVLAWTATANYDALLTFGNSTPAYGGTIDHYSISLLSGYFSTDTGAMIKMTGYHQNLSYPVASVIIGEPDVSWNNQYVELTSEAGDIDFVVFEGIGSADARLGFCADDVTIEVVPEPSTLAGLLVLFCALPLRRRVLR